MAWNMVVGVLHTFRRHVSLKQTVQFAGLLPPVLRALFIEGWDVDDEPTPFPSRSVLMSEVRAVRHEHNFAPDNAIAAVAKALRQHVDPEGLERVLGGFPRAAQEYWAVE